MSSRGPEWTRTDVQAKHLSNDDEGRSFHTPFTAIHPASKKREAENVEINRRLSDSDSKRNDGAHDP